VTSLGVYRARPVASKACRCSYRNVSMVRSGAPAVAALARFAASMSRRSPSQRPAARELHFRGRAR
jgi:hypothetical protein